MEVTKVSEFLPSGVVYVGPGVRPGEREGLGWPCLWAKLVRKVSDRGPSMKVRVLFGGTGSRIGRRLIIFQIYSLKR